MTARVGRFQPGSLGGGVSVGVGGNEHPWMQQIPRFGSSGIYPNLEKLRALSSIPKKSWHYREPLWLGATAARLCHLRVNKAEFRDDFASWQLWNNFFFALILLGSAWIRSWSSRAARLDFTRGRRNFRLRTRRGSSGKVGCLLLLFNQLERCRVELEVTGRGSRLVSGRGRIC